MQRDSRPRCKYCNSKVGQYQDICSECYKKLMLIRKLRAVVFWLRRQANAEKEG